MPTTPKTSSPAADVMVVLPLKPLVAELDANVPSGVAWSTPVNVMTVASVPFGLPVPVTTTSCVPVSGATMAQISTRASLPTLSAVPISVRSRPL